MLAASGTMAPKKDAKPAAKEVYDEPAWDGPMICLEVNVSSVSQLFVSCLYSHKLRLLSSSSSACLNMHLSPALLPMPCCFLFAHADCVHFFRRQPTGEAPSEEEQPPPALPATVSITLPGQQETETVQSEASQLGEDGNYAVGFTHKVSHPLNHDSLEVSRILVQ